MELYKKLEISDGAERVEKIELSDISWRFLDLF